MGILMSWLPKIAVFLAAVIVAPSAATAQVLPAAPAQTPGDDFPVVPFGHWAYRELCKLSGAGLLPGFAPNRGFRPVPLTRYEFAVHTARILSRLPPGAFPANWPGYEGTDGHLKVQTTSIGASIRAKSNDLRIDEDPGSYSPEILTAIEALRREFRPEITRLSTRMG